MATQPDFGELAGEMEKLRAQRAEKFQKHQEELRKAYEEKKAKEQAILDAEVARIKAEEEKKKKKELVTDADVKAAQERLERESLAHLQSFSFKAD